MQQQDSTGANTEMPGTGEDRRASEHGEGAFKVLGFKPVTPEQEAMGEKMLADLERALAKSQPKG